MWQSLRNKTVYSKAKFSHQLQMHFLSFFLYYYLLGQLYIFSFHIKFHEINTHKWNYIFKVIDQIFANNHLTFARSVIHRKFTPSAASVTQAPRGLAVSVIVATGRPIKGAVHTGVHMRGTGRWVAVSIKKIGIINSNVWKYARPPYCLYGYLKNYINKLNVNSSLVDKTHINFYNTHFVTKSKFVWLRLYGYHLR